MREKIRFIKYLKSQFVIFFGLKLTIRQLFREMRFIASAKISDEPEDNYFINRKTLDEAIQVLSARVEEGLLKYVGERKTVAFKVSAVWGDKNVAVSNEYWQKFFYALGWHEAIYGKQDTWWQKN